MDITKHDTALLVIDPPNDFLSEKGATWQLVGESVKENRTIENIEYGKTIVSSPHKVYGPENNDLALQLRKRKIDKVILAGMSANLCVEAHLRELLEQGFEVAVVKAMAVEELAAA